LPLRARARQCRGMVREDDPGTSTANGDPGGRGGLPVRAVREPTPDDVTAARAVVTAHLRPTPVVPVRLPGVEGEVLLKLESLQPTGSFKVRGALAAVAAYAASAGRVVTPSAGNAALGVAFRSEEHTSELQSRENLVCRLLLEKKTPHA